MLGAHVYNAMHKRRLAQAGAMPAARLLLAILHPRLSWGFLPAWTKKRNGKRAFLRSNPLYSSHKRQTFPLPRGGSPPRQGLERADRRRVEAGTRTLPSPNEERAGRGRGRGRYFRHLLSSGRQKQAKGKGIAATSAKVVLRSLCLFVARHYSRILEERCH